MGNLSTTAISPADAFAKIQAWIVGTGTGQLGWTLVDTITSGSDVVFQIPGSYARPTVYVRMTTNMKDEGLDPVGLHSNITFRLYRTWTVGTHSGTGEVGRIGPDLFMPPGYQATQNNAVFIPSKPFTIRHSETVPLLTSSANSGLRSNFCFNGKGAYFLDLNSPYPVRFYDLAQNTAYSINATATGFIPGTQCILTIDQQGREYLWTLRQTPTIGTYWQRYDVYNDTWTAMADPPWSGSGSYGMCPWAWDGADYIYVMFGSTGTSAKAFARYSISGNTWTSLASTPSPPSAFINYGVAVTGEASKMAYVPAAVSGHAHDEIYWGLNTTGDAIWWRYDVTSNTWAASPTTGLPSIPSNHFNYHGCFTWFDPTKGTNGTIYVCVGAATSGVDYIYPFDLATNTWGSRVIPWNVQNDVWSSTDYTAGYAAFWRRTYFGALRLPATSAALNIFGVGSADGFALVASWVPTGGAASIQRFIIVGFYNSYMKTDKFTTTGAISPGTGVTIAHDGSNTGKLLIGDGIEIYDPNASLRPQYRGSNYIAGGGETCTITAIPDSQHIMVDQVVGSYSTGVLIGQDIASCVVGNDDMYFGCLRSEYGYQFNGEGDYYVCQPVVSQARTGYLGRRNVAVLSALQLYNPNTLRPEYNTVGELPFVWTQNPLANANDTDTLNGHPYFVVVPWLRSRLSDPRGYEFGPTDG